MTRFFLILASFILTIGTQAAAQHRIPDHLKHAKLLCKIFASGQLRCASPNDVLKTSIPKYMDDYLSGIMAGLLAGLPASDTPFSCQEGVLYFVRGSANVTHQAMATAALECSGQALGGMSTNALAHGLDATLVSLQGQRTATVAYIDTIIGDCVDKGNSGIASDGGEKENDGSLWDRIKDVWNYIVNSVEYLTDWNLNRAKFEQQSTDTATADTSDANTDDGPQNCDELPTEGEQVDCRIAEVSEVTDTPNVQIADSVAECAEQGINPRACVEALEGCIFKTGSIDKCGLKELKQELIENLMEYQEYINYPGPDGMFGGSCEQARAKWDAFKQRCELSNWQEFSCDQFLRAMNGCVGDPTRTRPGPDQVDACFSQVSEEDIKKRRCEAQGGIWTAGTTAAPNCNFIGAALPSFPAYTLCHDPEANLLAEQCAPTIALPALPGGSTVPAPSPIPSSGNPAPGGN